MISLSKNQQEIQGKSKGNFVYFMICIVYSFMLIYDLAAFPGGASSKEIICQCRRCKRRGFNAWVGKISLEEGMATHSNILAWRMLWTEEPGWLQPIWLKRVRHDWSESAHTQVWLSDWTIIELLETDLFSLSLTQALLLRLLSRFSRVWLCATPQTAAHQALPTLGFSRQEHWSGLPFPSPMHESEKWKWSRSVMSDT